VLIASVSGRWPDGSGPGYQATKAGVHALAHGLAFEEHTNGVRVCAILPGAIDTALVDKRPVVPAPKLRAKMLRGEDIAARLEPAGKRELARLTRIGTRQQAVLDLCLERKRH